MQQHHCHLLPIYHPWWYLASLRRARAKKSTSTEAWRSQVGQVSGNRKTAVALLNKLELGSQPACQIPRARNCQLKDSVQRVITDSCCEPVFIDMKLELTQPIHNLPNIKIAENYSLSIRAGCERETHTSQSPHKPKYYDSPVTSLPAQCSKFPLLLYYARSLYVKILRKQS